MKTIIINLIITSAVVVSSQWASHDHKHWKEDGYSHINKGVQEKRGGLKDGLALLSGNKPTFAMALQEPEDWDLNIEGFSPAYYDKVRGAIAVNTVEQPTDQWAAASSPFVHNTGMYTIRFTSLLESDGECFYILKIGPKKVLEFQNPRIYGKEIAEYAPHEEEVKNVTIEKGSLIQVEFLPHSNGLVPEGEAFGFARGRWKNNIEFIPQKEE